MSRVDIIAKFNKDVANRSRIERLLIATDQWFAVLFWNTSQDETISSCVGRRIEAGTANWFDRLVCKGLRKLQAKHCMRSIGE